MLKDSTPQERLQQAFGSFRKLGVTAYFVSYAGMLFLFFARGKEDPVPVLYAIPFLAVAMTIGGVLGIFIWLPLSSWLGHLNFVQTMDAVAEPNANPRSAERFLNAWWENEGVLDTFFVVFTVTFCVGSYYFLGPIIGIL